jgi:putative membrane protein
MIELFSIAFKDFLTKKFIILSILPLVGSLIILSSFMVLGGNELYKVAVSNTSGDNYFSTIAIILNFSFVKWLISTFFYTVGAYFVLMVSIFIAMFIVGFLTPIIVAEINRRHYHINNLAQIPTFTILKLICIVFLKFMVLFFISLLFLVIPVINLFVIQIPFFYLYYSLTFIDVASNTLRKSKFELYLLDFGGIKFKIVSLLFYILCLIPFVGLIGQIYFIIYFSHFFLQKESMSKIS